MTLDEFLEACRAVWQRPEARTVMLAACRPKGVDVSKA